MTQGLTAGEIRGRAIGSLFFAAYGSASAFTSLGITHRISVSTAIATDIAFLALVFPAIWLFRQSRSFPSTPVAQLVQMRSRALRINMMEWAAIVAVCIVLARLHLANYIPSAITVVIGLHFLPLARIFRYRLHIVTGIVMLIWVGLTTCLVPVSQLRGVIAAGNAAIFWVSAVVMLALAVPLARVPRSVS